MGERFLGCFQFFLAVKYFYSLYSTIAGVYQVLA